MTFPRTYSGIIKGFAFETGDNPTIEIQCDIEYSAWEGTLATHEEPGDPAGCEWSVSTIHSIKCNDSPVQFELQELSWREFIKEQAIEHDVIDACNENANERNEP